MSRPITNWKRVTDTQSEIRTALDNSGSTDNSNLPFLLSVQLGLVEGMQEYRKFGYNPLINTASDPEDIWAGSGLYTGFADDAETLEIFSDSAQDVLGGTGVSALEIFGRSNGIAVNETVILNGTTPVTTVNEYERMTRAYATRTVGSNGSNVGNITIRQETTTANVMAVIQADLGQTQLALDTIPRGKTLYVSHIDASLVDGGANNAQIFLIGRANNGPWRVLDQFGCSDDSAAHQNYGFTLAIPEGWDYVLRVVEVQNNGAAVSASVVGVLVDN